MTDELNKDTEENPEEEETPEETPEEETPEEPQKEEKETPKEKTESPKEEFTDREKRYYARMKDAEEAAKKAKKDLADSKKPVSDVDAIVEVQQATEGLSPEEIAELRFRAAATGKSLSEARKDENFILWQNAHKEKVEKDQTLPPSTKQSETKKVKDLADMTVKEKEEALIKMGVDRPSWVKQKKVWKKD